MRISDWSSDVCSSDLSAAAALGKAEEDAGDRNQKQGGDRHRQQGEAAPRPARARMAPGRLGAGRVGPVDRRLAARHLAPRPGRLLAVSDHPPSSLTAWPALPQPPAVAARAASSDKRTRGDYPTPTCPDSER